MSWTRQARGRPLGHLRAAVPWAQGLMLYCTGATSNTVTLTFVSPALPGQGQGSGVFREYPISR
jgi:hypothetical protein